MYWSPASMTTSSGWGPSPRSGGCSGCTYRSPARGSRGGLARRASGLPFTARPRTAMRFWSFGHSSGTRSSASGCPSGRSGAARLQRRSLAARARRRLGVTAGHDHDRGRCCAMRSPRVGSLELAAREQALLNRRSRLACLRESLRDLGADCSPPVGGADGGPQARRGIPARRSCARSLRLAAAHHARLLPARCAEPRGGRARLGDLCRRRAVPGGAGQASRRALGPRHAAVTDCLGGDGQRPARGGRSPPRDRE